MPDQRRRRPILLIANPEAGHKPGGVNADQVLTPEQLLARLRGGGLAVELHQLAGKDDVGVLAKAAAQDGRDVVIAGGDGTVGPAAAGLIGTGATLGIIPLGTFNNIARGAGVPVESAESTMVAKQTVELDAAKARQALRLVELLEDLEDVSRVTANFDIPEEVFAEVAG